jgi:hypothetical protein
MILKGANSILQGASNGNGIVMIEEAGTVYEKGDWNSR